MTRRVDFGKGAQAYDRRHGALLSHEIASELVSAAGLAFGARVLEVGAGTGRVSVALAALGLRAVAVEPSRPMLTVLQSKEPRGSVRVAEGEGAHLPFGSAQFDAVVLARILWDVPEDVLQQSLPQLESWVEARFDLAQTDPIPREISWTVYRADRR